jgi:hypothetical protein
MSSIVCVHGAFHELWGPHQIAARWIPALRDGLHLAGADVDPADVTIAFYGDLFRLDAGHEPTADELHALAARTGILEAATRIGGPDALAGMAALVGQEQVDRTVEQLGRYIDEAALRDAIRQRIRQAIGPDTRVVVAHSLGTLATYEALVDDATLPAVHLVTFGAVLGRPIVASGALGPALTDGRGTWPPTVRTWTNVTAVGDMVADGFPLAPVFSGVVEQRVDNGHRAHEPEPYLCARVTGQAIAAGLGATA